MKGVETLIAASVNSNAAVDDRKGRSQCFNKDI